MESHGLGYSVGQFVARMGWPGWFALISTTVLFLSMCSTSSGPPNEARPAPAVDPAAAAAQAEKASAARARAREAILAADEPIARDTKRSATERLQAITRITAVAPDRAKDLEPIRTKLAETVERERKTAEAKAAAEERARKKREGVSIGMTRDDVLASSWGKPQRINTTTTARGVTEQWVYGSGSYLYFTDGLLTAIQN